MTDPAIRSDHPDAVTWNRHGVASQRDASWVGAARREAIRPEAPQRACSAGQP